MTQTAAPPIVSLAKIKRKTLSSLGFWG